MDNFKLKIFANCIVVKGYNRSLICDLQRSDFIFIPNEMKDLLINHENKSLEEIKSFYDEMFHEMIEDNIRYLEKTEYVFFCKNPSFFPKLSLDWHYPFSITNAILDCLSIDNYVKILMELDELKCKNIELRFFYDFDFNLIYEIINFIHNSKFIITTIGFVIPYNENNIEKINFILNYSARISYIIIFNTPNEQINILKSNVNKRAIYISKNIYSESSCGVISSKLFSINIKTFTESHHHNTCLNRKISIDKDGFIRNCPSMPQHFGNIKDTRLSDALNHPDFKKYWNVNKDMIAVCKDCEFRHICTDCRAYTERTHFEEDIDLSKPLKCGYNPYTNEWAEWSTNPLKQKAIEYYGMQDLVKKDA